jgi:hypothetical protein
MPRQSKGARLWLRERRGRVAQWVILDHGREFRTGAEKPLNPWKSAGWLILWQHLERHI